MKSGNIDNDAITKSITKLIKGFFDDDNTNGYAQSLEKLKVMTNERLQENSGKNEVKVWVNKNSSAFLRQITEFIEEHHKGIQSMVDGGKYHDLKELVSNGIAKDILTSLSMTEMPPQVVSNPKRRDPAVIAEAIEPTKNLLQDADIAGSADLIEYIEHFMKDKLSSAPKSSYEKDNDIDFDRKNNKKPALKKEYDNDYSLNA